jgi:hypothetical protein
LRRKYRVIRATWAVVDDTPPDPIVGDRSPMIRILVLLVMGFFASATWAQDVRINIGGPAVTQPAGVVWAADTFGLGLPDGGAAAAAVTGTTAPDVFKTARWFTATTSYAIPVQAGRTYTVRTHHADTWAGTHKVGARVFALEVNGQVRGPIDIFARAGANKAHIETWTGIQPIEGKITITLRMGAADNPVLSAIEAIAETAVIAETGLRVSWQHATQNDDGTPLLDRTGYRVERAAQEAGPWTSWATTDATTASGRVPVGRSCVRVTTLTATAESLPSPALCVQKPADTSVPQAPGGVSATFVELALVNGVASGARAVYARSSTGSRGNKLGDLQVGPVAQTAPPVNRVRCSRTDTLQAGTATLYRVIDTRAPEPLRAGYVAGCVSYGLQ